jgi:hypothetical protein
MITLRLLAAAGVILGAIDLIRAGIWVWLAVERRRETRAAIKRLGHRDRRELSRFRGVLHDDLYIADQVTRWGGSR